MNHTNPHNPITTPLRARERALHLAAAAFPAGKCEPRRPPKPDGATERVNGLVSTLQLLQQVGPHCLQQSRS